MKRNWTLDLKIKGSPSWHIEVTETFENVERRWLFLADHQVQSGYRLVLSDCRRTLASIYTRKVPSQWDQVYHTCWIIPVLIGVAVTFIFWWGLAGPISIQSAVLAQNVKVKRSLGKTFLMRYSRLILWFFSVDKDTQYKRLRNRIQKLLDTNGNKFTVEYLKECVRLINHFIAGRPTESPQLDGSPRVASRRGLPLIIPGPLRLQMEARDRVVIRVVLTMLSIFRIIKYKGTLKLSTITSPFKGLSQTLHPVEVAIVWKLFTPYLPNFSIDKLGISSPLILKTAGPNYKTSILGAPKDALAWSQETFGLRKAFQILSDNFGCSGLWQMLQEEIQIVSGMDLGNVKLGKLSQKLEPAGKIRIFAIADVWTQSVLKPLHEYIFLILRNIPQDGTFDQAKPLNTLKEKLKIKSNKWVASYDLSAATDRLPIEVQVQFLSQLLGNREVAEAWRDLLVNRPWYLREVPYKYSVGQPMGALSSWGMLALTHHALVQYSAYRAGIKGWFEDYALLGDDIVIADEAVAERYLYVMQTWLGVDINMSKSLVSDIGVMEFAKRVADPEGEFTPLGPKNISGVLKNPAMLPSLLLDYIGKGGTVDWAWVMTKFNQIYSMKDVLRVSKSGVEALVWTVLQPFGFVPFPGLTSSQIVSSHGEEEFDQYLVLEAIDQALADLRQKEEDKALVKTMESVNALKKYVAERKEFSRTPPSLLALLTNSEEILQQIGRIIQEDSDIYVDPTGLTLSEILLIKLRHQSGVSPLDNVLARPKVQRPRIKHLNLDFFKLVRRYCVALQQW